MDLADVSARRHRDVALLGRASALRDVRTTDVALYVALAEALGRPLLTRDARLSRYARLSRGMGAASDVRFTVRLTACSLGRRVLERTSCWIGEHASGYSVRSAARAAASPGTPWTAPPGNAAALPRKSPRSGVLYGDSPTVGRKTTCESR